MTTTTARTLAILVLNTVRIREASYIKATPANEIRSEREAYDMDLPTAAAQVCKRMGEDEMSDAVFFALFGAWNNMIEWATEVLVGKWPTYDESGKNYEQFERNKKEALVRAYDQAQKIYEETT